MKFHDSSRQKHLLTAKDSHKLATNMLQYCQTKFSGKEITQHNQSKQEEIPKTAWGDQLW